MERDTRGDFWIVFFVFFLLCSPLYDGVVGESMKISIFNLPTKLKNLKWVKGGY